MICVLLWIQERTLNWVCRASSTQSIWEQTADYFIYLAIIWCRMSHQIQIVLNHTWVFRPENTIKTSVKIDCLRSWKEKTTDFDSGLIFNFNIFHARDLIVIKPYQQSEIKRTRNLSEPQFDHGLWLDMHIAPAKPQMQQSNSKFVVRSLNTEPLNRMCLYLTETWHYMKTTKKKKTRKICTRVIANTFKP